MWGNTMYVYGIENVQLKQNMFPVPSKLRSPRFLSYLGKVCDLHYPWRVGRVFLSGGRPVSPSRSKTFLLLRHGRRPTGVALELGRLWFVRCKRAIRETFLGYSCSATL